LFLPYNLIHDGGSLPISQNSCLPVINHVNAVLAPETRTA